ncbi:sulfatase-like hydrolase/transferase [Burkholderia sp. Ax-1719]|uniref:sulfatase-like hydrolase/transferase n=1 Tax=Burkholderia sp. Ax-1719 TaxID=2608334 RepID=UPI00142138CE|nr:sulfatase-like hydrolase/transferase [Burkholderia sp. Ax-1719]NIE64638.1 sulfatase-like hydrolase/transferase [Burkholderia sp. Ax-1719]
MNDGTNGSANGGRRNFLKAAGAAVATVGVSAAAPATGMAAEAPRAASAPDGVPAFRQAASAPGQAPEGYNILFILTDQERHFDAWPFPVPGRTALRRDGITFANHQIASCVCSPSRSTIYTGQHTQHTGVLDNAGVPWQPDMSPDIRTVGDMMRDAGYYAAYLGKWHLSSKLHETASPYTAPVSDYNHTIKEYGFDDYFGVGDLIGMVRGGYNYDGITTESAVSWMRNHAPRLAKEGKPWFLAVNLVNPHDVMFVNTDPAGSNLQDANKPMLGNAHPPEDALYQQKWDRVPLAASRHQPYDEPGRPPAHGMFNAAHANLVGRYPFTDERIRIYQDNYFNCLRDCDTHVVRLLQSLQSLGLDERTIVVMTADHGDHVGAHQLVGKGATAYQPQNHVPLVIRHPAYPGGKHCDALTSHIDVAPTLLGLAGLDDARRAAIGGPALKGKNLAPWLAAPEKAQTNSVRDTALFNYAMLLYYDSEWMLKELSTLREKGVPEDELRRRALAQQPDFRLRGTIRSVFDGRYRFTRYFSPLQFNTPTSLETLFAQNDVELYDVASDPGEMRNLAVDRKRNGELLLAMNDKLNAAIANEVGDDNPDVMPIRDGKVQVQIRSFH